MGKASDKTVVVAHGLNGPKMVSDYDPFAKPSAQSGGSADSDEETKVGPAD